MAPTKKLNLRENPPTASSGDDSSFSDEIVVTPPPKPTYGSDSSSDSSSDDSDSEEIALKQQAFEKLKASLSSPSKNSRKRPNGSDGDNKKEKKRAKVEDSKQKRVFSDNDAIVLLNGILEFKENTGTDPTSDLVGFFDNVKDSLDYNPSLEQLKNKLKKMKERFKNTLKKMRGEEIDEEWYALSRKIWGGGESATPIVKSNVKAAAASGSGVEKRPTRLIGKAAIEKPPTTPSNGKAVASSGVEKPPTTESKGKAVGSLGVENDNVVRVEKMNDKEFEEYAFECGLEAADSTTRAELDDRWRELRIGRLRLLVEERKLKLMQAELALKAAIN